jgi:hypothetical protein
MVTKHTSKKLNGLNQIARIRHRKIKIGTHCVHVACNLNPYDALALILQSIQITLTTNVPNFVAKFASPLRSSKVHKFVNYAFDWLQFFSLQGPIRDFVYKLACQFQQSEHLWSKFREIDWYNWPET